MAQFDDIKAGDQVVISDRSAGRRIAIVERVTATQFVAGGVRFTKHGCKVGEGNIWHFTTVQCVTPELLLNVATEQRYDSRYRTLRVLEDKLKTARMEIDRSSNKYDYTDAIIAASAHLERAIALLTKQENHND